MRTGRLPWHRLSALALAAFLSAAVQAWGADMRALAVGQERSRDEYQSLVRQVSLSKDRAASLAAEIATVRKDQASISEALVASAAHERDLSGQIDDSIARLEPLKAAESRIRLSLIERRGVLAEVLGALERMGLSPPPAVLVTPDDALSSVRSAILLGAVLPGLRGETDRLIGDLREAKRVSGAIEAERDRLKAAVEGQAAERKRLAMLLDGKRKLGAGTETELLAERWRSAELAAKAGSLKELIADLERQAETAGAERKADEEKRVRDIALSRQPVPEENRLGAGAGFGSLRRQLPLPAAGRIAARFGTEDGNGAVMAGDMLATQSGAIVAAPADGIVLYAGPFRSYRQLLILNAGDGYHVVLAGMDRINVAQGQSVLAGEPVGGMADAQVASAAPAGEPGAARELYVEFRKDGKPIDPSPWWAERTSGRKRNGT